MPDHSYFSNLIWSIADLLRGPHRPPQYERVMLPITVLRRFDCVLAHAMNSPIGRAQVEVGQYGAAQEQFNIGHAVDFRFAPPLEEQRAIVEYIARDTARLDAVRAATERTIALLKERRSALIAAEVTGHFDVASTESTACTAKANVTGVQPRSSKHISTRFGRGG